MSPAGSPVVQFARFVPGGVCLFKARTADVEFIAISHSWGKTRWIHVPILGREILASKEKAAFINKGLAKLVGSKAFWMDTITVDQRDADEVIATVQCIPAIFRDAEKTIALREREGLIDCCAGALEDFSDIHDLRQRTREHAKTHFGREYAEAYLERLWTFQECVLSHTIQFVLYGPCQFLIVLAKYLSLVNWAQVDRREPGKPPTTIVAKPVHVHWLTPSTRLRMHTPPMKKRPQISCEHTSLVVQSQPLSRPSAQSMMTYLVARSKQCIRARLEQRRCREITCSLRCPSFLGIIIPKTRATWSLAKFSLI